MDQATAPPMAYRRRVHAQTPMAMKGWCPVNLSGYVRLYTDKFAREDCKNYSVHFSGSLHGCRQRLALASLLHARLCPAGALELQLSADVLRLIGAAMRAADADSHLWLQVNGHDGVWALYRLDGWQDKASLRITTMHRGPHHVDDEDEGAEGGEERRAPPPGSGVAVTIESDDAFSVHCRGVCVGQWERPEKNLHTNQIYEDSFAVTSDARFLAMADYWEDGDDREYPDVTVFDLGAVLDAFGVAEQRLGAAAAASVSCAKETAAEKPTKAASAKGSTKVAPTADDAAKEAEATAAKAKAKEEAAAAALKARKEAMRSAMRSAVQRRRAAAASWQVREAAAEAKTQ